VIGKPECRGGLRNWGRGWSLRGTAWILVIAAFASPLSARGKGKGTLEYGAGLIVNIPAPPADVTEAVQDVAGNGIIRGTKEYNKDEYVSGAIASESTPVFAAWKDAGKVFYKVRKAALNPWNFKDSADVGTLAVRYIVQAQGDKNSVLRIDAIFVEDFRRTVHPSNGSVESSEYKDIQDHLGQMQLLKKETEEAQRQKQEHVIKQNFGLSNSTELLSTPSTADVDSSGESSSRPETFAHSKVAAAGVSRDPNETPEQHLDNLRHEVERLVKKPGAPLKSAPFHTASTLEPLRPGTEVLIVISTPYWFGVETHDGRHGWIPRDQLEPLP
jgi:hypothetical protein